MNEHLELLCTALESGEFKQGKGQLRSNDEFCCLGVGCELYRREHPEARWEVIDNRWYFAAQVGRSATILPSLVTNWLGLATNTGCFADDTSLSCENDKGTSFSQIAALIRSQPDGLLAS